MLDTSAFHSRLEAAMADTSGIIVPAGHVEASYFDSLRESIRKSLCEPFIATATVEEPGFPGMEIGQKISAYVFATSDGYYLAYEPAQDQFYCFWGTAPDNLGAHGVSGNPLYCWWE